MEETPRVEPIPQVESLRKAMRTLTLAVWCLCVVVVALLAFYFYSFYRSWAFNRGATSSSSISSEGAANGKAFFDLTPEEKIKRATAILVTKHQQDGRKIKAVVVEILKQQPNAKPHWSVGDEVVSLSHYSQDGTGFGDGDVVLFVGSTRDFREAATYTNDRIMAMGDMPLDTLREIVKGSGSVSPRATISPSTAARIVTAGPEVSGGPLIELEETTSGEGITRGFSISRSAAMKIPEWLPEKGEPPLAMSKSIRLATEAAQAESVAGSTFVARAVRIQLASCEQPVGNRWYYVVDCVPREGGGLGMSRSVPVVVLMDGTVVTGRIKNG